MLFDDSRPLREELMVPMLSFFDLPTTVLLNIESFLSLDEVFELIRLSESWMPSALSLEELFQHIRLSDEQQRLPQPLNHLWSF